MSMKLRVRSKPPFQSTIEHFCKYIGERQRGRGVEGRLTQVFYEQKRPVLTPVLTHVRFNLRCHLSIRAENTKARESITALLINSNPLSPGHIVGIRNQSETRIR